MLYRKHTTHTDVANILTGHKQGSEEIPEITSSEIEMAISEIENNKASVEDGIMIENIKARGKELINALKVLFNVWRPDKFLRHGIMPS